MTKIENQQFTGERSLFNSKDLEICGCRFFDGESPLKESESLNILNTSFQWKYPLWYCKHVSVTKSVLEETARSGIWYTNDIIITDSLIAAPKTFRRSSNITLCDVKMPNALETLWNCKNISVKNVTANGDYFGFNSSNIVVENLHLDGNYCFDGGRNITIRNSYLNSKDAIWNCKNVTIEDSTIIGEYFGWNSKDITLINCTVESDQGFCYMENVKLVNCKLINTTLSFEYSTVEAEIKGEVDSIKNPISGIIKVGKVKELILDETKIDPTRTTIIQED